MSKVVFAVWIFALSTLGALAQSDWVENEDGTLEYNCRSLTAIAEEYGEQIYTRQGDDLLTFAKAHQQELAECATVSNNGDAVLYKININPGTNIRDAATTASTILGKGQSGTVYEVYSETEGTNYVWLEIQLDGETAYVAQNLTTRLPDLILDPTGDSYLLPGTSCIVYHKRRRDRRTTINPVLYGDEARDRIEVDVYKPGSDTPVPIYRSDFDFNTDGTYQRYSQWWGSGNYTLEIRGYGQMHRVGFTVDGTYTHFLGVSCE